jgi:hypothetical protein
MVPDSTASWPPPCPNPEHNHTGKPDNAIHNLRVSLEGAQLLAASGVPEFHGLVITGRSGADGQDRVFIAAGVRVTNSRPRWRTRPLGTEKNEGNEVRRDGRQEVVALW